MDLRVKHVLNDELKVGYGNQLLFRYVYNPKSERREAPKPYFHPLYTLAGDEVSLFRPYDHVWHKGLAMTSASVSGHNFWGGPSYRRDQGYVHLDNHGCIEHQSWQAMVCENNALTLREALQWRGYDGATLLYEKRVLHVDDIDPQNGYWRLRLCFFITNVSETPLDFSSPTVEGRPMAGYGGLFWRGPRSFTQGKILTQNCEGPEAMGCASPWLAYSGSHDGSARQSTLIFIESSDNAPSKWFVRNEPFACASASFMFDRIYTLKPESTLKLDYQVVIANGEWTRKQIEEYVQQALNAWVPIP